MKPEVSVVPVGDILRRCRALVFDFDGTLVDSNDIKWRGFEVAFADFPEHMGKIMAFCRDYHHTSREEKFRYVYEKILGLAFTPEIGVSLQERFAAATTRQIIEAPETPGATRFLGVVACNRLTALLSSTPHQVLLRILAERVWREYFGIVRGAPVDKGTWLEAFREKHKLQKEEIVFFGDTAEDAGAARAAGCTFVAVGNPRLGAEAICSVADFAELLTS